MFRILIAKTLTTSTIPLHSNSMSFIIHLLTDHIHKCNEIEKQKIK